MEGARDEEERLKIRFGCPKEVIQRKSGMKYRRLIRDP